jgi:maltose O-acetyltransferase
MTEKEKMLAGQIYDACNPEILSELFTTQDAVFEYNQIRPTDHALRTEKIKQILGKTGERVIVNQPFHCDYGSNISVGEGFFANFNLTVLDEAPVTIGDNCFIGPNVGLYTACHPTDPVARNSRQEWAEPITIGHNVWIGGGVTVLPGVTIGDNVTIGAGSVVAKDIPSNCVAVGNPCRPVKWLEESEQDSQ